MKTLERAFPWLLCAPALLPVVVGAEIIYPYLVPKTLLFYALSLISLAAFVILASHGRPFHSRRLARRENWIPLALLALAYLASALGIDFYHSFWSLLVRGDGLLMFTGVVLSFYLILLSADRAFFDRLLLFVAGIGTLVAAYGVGEWLLEGGRVGSLLGNAGFFAGYLGIAAFATLAASAKLESSWRRRAQAAAALQFLAIVLTATRGTILALLACGVVALVWLALKREGKHRVLARRALAVLGVVAVLFVALRGELARVPFGPVSRIASIGAHDPDVASRLFLWKNLLGQIAARPLLGYGAESVETLFNRFYDPTQIGEEWFDRSHNAYLDYAAQFGIGGALLYIALIVLVFRYGRRRDAQGDPRGKFFMFLALSYAIQNFFVFDTISSFWLFMALLAGLAATAHEDGPGAPLTLPAWSRYASWPLALVLVLLVIPVSVKPLFAAYDIAQAYKYQLVDSARSAGYLSSAVALDTFGDREAGYLAYDMYAHAQSAKLSGKAREVAYESARGVLARDFARYPYDARTALYYAHVLALAPPGTPADNDALSAALQRAVDESPKRSQPWFILANLSLNQANAQAAGSSGRSSGYAAAKSTLARYLALVPTLSQPHYVLAELDLASGDAEGAAREAALGRQYYRSDLDTAHRAAGYYEGQRDWPNAVFFLGEVAQLDPSDAVSRYDLAKVTYLSGNLAGADAIASEIRRTNPSLFASDPNFVSAITAYEQSAK